MQSKRKRLEQLTSSALKSSSKTVDDIWKVQSNERFVICHKTKMFCFHGPILSGKISLDSQLLPEECKTYRLY